MSALGKGRQTATFAPAELPKFEILFYFAVWILHSAAAFVVACSVSTKLRPWIEHRLQRSEYVRGYYVDISDPEWTLYRISIREVIYVNFLHLGVFYTVPKLFSAGTSRCILTLFWISSAIYLTSPSCVFLVILLAVVASGLTFYVRNQFIGWILCILFVLEANSYAYFSFAGDIYYREFSFYLYSAIKVLNFCIYVAKNVEVRLDAFLVIRFAQYLFYPPYSAFLIVLFDDFNEQMSRAEALHEGACERSPSLRYIMLRLARVALWFFVFETILHFVYVISFFNAPYSLINGLNNYEVASIAYVNGQLFYMKYVIIFGIPSWFAMADGMKPPEPPICISRVSRYSRMWRYFDRGLYNFLKNQVYVPLIGAPKSPYFHARRFAAMVSAFLFVLAWHGTSSNYVYWVTLSGVGLTVEHIGSALADCRLVQSVFRALGPRGTRRLVAVAMIATVIPGIFGVFFFLGREEIGSTIFKNVLVDGFLGACKLQLSVVDGWPSPGLVFVHLILLGYCFNHVCLQLDKSFPTRTSVATEERKKA